MDFNDKSAIYQQIADIMCQKIMSDEWLVDAKIPSIRELAVDLEVNPNTAIRSFEYLQNQGVIYNKRGIGYFVASDGPAKVRKLMRDEFINSSLPALFKSMVLLDISIDDIESMFNTYKQTQQVK